ncbi:MAG: TIGR02221 family CRISPR-associated protein [Mediterranea sp.]|jgi:CRISPR-associated Csx2 family protein|nr:TIGR02221 family CRISPR-associated protein [Mediterranea sp.]
MGRKVFISFLGSSFYGECAYHYEEFTSSKTRFVQRATIEWIMREAKWTEEDKAIILVTDGDKGSKVNNWDKRFSTRVCWNSKTCQHEEVEYPHLERIISEMELPFAVTPIIVKEGKNEKEIWEIFKAIVREVEDEDELYLDLTHGFRYLPMLLLVLGNYLKLLKKAQVKHLSYGNYEGLADGVAPFVNLLPFSQLQDWTMAAKDFIKYGKVDELSDQLSVKTFKQKFKNDSDEVSAAYGIDAKLKGLSSFITYNRLDNIKAGMDITKEMDILERERNILPEPFFPLLGEIKEKVSIFKQDTLENVFAATSWCIQHEMYQNAYSILLEGVISILLERVSIPYKVEGNDSKFVEECRDVVTYVADAKSPKKDRSGNIIETALLECVRAYTCRLEGKEDEIKKIIEKIWEYMDVDLASRISTLSKKRNAYMHAGTGTNSLGKDKGIIDMIRKSHEELYEKLYPKNEKGTPPC